MNDIPELWLKRLKQSDSLNTAYCRLPMLVQNKVKGNKPFFDEVFNLLIKSLDLILECKQKGEFIDDGYTLKQIKLERANKQKGISFFNRLYVLAEAYDAGHIQARSSSAKYAFNQLLMSGLLLAMVSIGNDGECE